MKRNILLLSVAIAAIIVLLSWYAASKQTEYTGFAMGSMLAQTIWEKPRIVRPSAAGDSTKKSNRAA